MTQALDLAPLQGGNEWTPRKKSSGVVGIIIGVIFVPVGLFLTFVAVAVLSEEGMGEQDGWMFLFAGLIMAISPLVPLWRKSVTWTGLRHDDLALIAGFAHTNGGRYLSRLEATELPPYTLSREARELSQVVRLPGAVPVEVGNLLYTESRAYGPLGYVRIPLGFEPPHVTMSLAPTNPANEKVLIPLDLGRQRIRYGRYDCYVMPGTRVPQRLLDYVQRFPEPLEVEFGMSSVFVRLRTPASTAGAARWALVEGLIRDLQSIAALEARQVGIIA